MYKEKCAVVCNESVFLSSIRRVAVPDARYDWLCQYWKPASQIPAFLHVVDIAGLVKGAHEGQVGQHCYTQCNSSTNVEPKASTSQEMQRRGLLQIRLLPNN